MYFKNQHFFLPILFFAFDITADADEPKDFTFLSKEEFCTAKHNLLVNPKFIPVLLDYLRYCSALSNMPNGNGPERRHALMHLFETATPVLHKAFFDSKTGLKQTVTFTKMKQEAVQYTKYADKYENSLFLNGMRVNRVRGVMTYNPSNDNGSYSLEDDLRLCSEILNRQPDVSVKNLIKPSQLPRVAKAARLITFPPFNLTVGVTGEDTSYMILDMYVLAMRCLSFTNLSSDTNAQVSENLINWLKKKIMPYIPPHEFEKAYSGMMSLLEHRSALKPRANSAHSSQTSTVKCKALLKVEDDLESSQSTGDGPILLKLQYDFKVPNDAHQEESSDSSAGTTTIGNELGTKAQSIFTGQHSCRTTTEPSPTESELQEDETSPLATDDVELLSDSIADADKILNSDEEEEEDVGRDSPYPTIVAECHACHPKFSTKYVAIIGAAVGSCGTLALILYCLLFGCCGWVSVSRSSTKSEEDVDDIDSYLDGYTRQRMSVEGHVNRCYCTLADTNQMDVIVALHKRCEILSKKICDVIHEISKESIFEETTSVEMLREFIRNISEEMVDDDETLRQLKRIHERSNETQKRFELQRK